MALSSCSAAVRRTASAAVSDCSNRKHMSRDRITLSQPFCPLRIGNAGIEAEMFVDESQLRPAITWSGRATPLDHPCLANRHELPAAARPQAVRADHYGVRWTLPSCGGKEIRAMGCRRATSQDEQDQDGYRSFEAHAFDPTPIAAPAPRCGSQFPPPAANVDRSSRLYNDLVTALTSFDALRTASGRVPMHDDNPRMTS